MSSMIRKMMRNVTRKWGAKRQTLNGRPAVGSQRAGMHQAAEHEYRRAIMQDSAPVEETAEEALDVPAEIEAEIPPVEEEDDEIVEEIAEGETAVAAEPEIVEEIADPEMAVNEEEENTEDVVEQFSVDWSGERIPVIDPVTGGTGVSADTPLEYSSGDGSLKEIQEPLPGLGEKLGIPPLFNGIPDPSANVAAAPEPEPEPDPEPVEPSE